MEREKGDIVGGERERKRKGERKREKAEERDICYVANDGFLLIKMTCTDEEAIDLPPGTHLTSP